MNKKGAKRLLAVLLCLVMLMGTVPVASAAETKSGGVTWEQVDGSASPDRFQQEAVTDPEEAPLYADDEIVRVSIVLEAAPTVAVYSAENDISENRAAMNYRQQLLNTQKAMADTIAKKALGKGETLDVVYNLTLVANVISANVPYGEIDKIKAVDGVEDVVVATRFTPDVVSIGDADPQMEVSTGMTGSSIAWSNGYTGAGMRIAIVDTGLDLTHQSFNSAAYDYAIAEDAKNDGVSVESYDLLDKAEIAEKLPQLHVSQMSGASADDLYVSSKIPFGFNYVDQDLDLEHVNDQEGEHGSHVAGIAAANRYLNDNGTFTSALDSVHMVGNAPDAQVLVMKVFGKGGGAYTDDYMAAIEDAIILGCDTVNLSLGSSVAGMAYDRTFSGMLESMSSSGTVVTISAGNNGAWAENTAIGALYSDDVNFQTGGSPGSYTNSLGVASVDNDGVVSPYFSVDGASYAFNDGSGTNEPFVTLDTTGTGTDYDYIFIDGMGDESDYAALGDLVKDKIVFCKRGSINFSAKAQNAFDNGAAASVVYNNVADSINMDLSGYTGTAPCVSISMLAGAKIKAASTAAATEGGYTYYTGKLTVFSQIGVTNYNSAYQTMSSFSSWGVPGDLSIKPEITAPGGNIFSLNGTHQTETGAIAGGSDQYELMSGTSMAAPQMAGIGALVKQAIEQRGISQNGLSDRALAQSLMMSTATPLTDADGDYYSVLQQGAGLVNADAATTADSYVLVSGQDDGKVKVELGDDAAKTGTYSFTFTINNLDGKAHQYNLNADVFTQAPAADSDGTLYMLGSTVSLDYSDISWTVDGKSADPAVDLSGYDFDGDGDVDMDDAQALLDYITGVRASINDKANADLDADGDIDTYDVHLFLVNFTTGQVTVPASGSVTVTGTISLDADEAAELMSIYPNGFYVEAYAKISAVPNGEGAVGTSHSIPVLGFYGNWTSASMFDKGGYIEYSYGLEDRYPYLYSGNQYNMNTNVLLIQYAGDPSQYYFGLNPYEDDAEYDASRVSLNNQRGDTLAAWRYSAIRNAAASRVTVTNTATGEEVYNSGNLGSATGAWWNATQSSWQNMNPMARFGWSGKGLNEGDTAEIKLTLAPELYVNNENGVVDWASLGDGASRTVQVTIDNTAPVVNSITYNEADGTLTVNATDNRYVAAAFLFSQGGELLDNTGSLEDIEPNEAGDYTLSLANAEEGAKNFMVQLYDYADNVTTVRLTLGEEPSPATSISISPDAITVLAGGTVSVALSVEPWNADDTFTWVSSNEDVATVSDGVITGVAPGKCTVTASSVKDPAITSTCAVTVKTVDIDLNAVVWDEDAVTYWSSFNPQTLPDYTAIKACGYQFDSAADTVDGKIYAASMNDSSSDATLYVLDDDLNATKVGNVGIGVADMADAPSLGNYLLGLYGPYILLIDKTTGAYTGAWNWSSGESLVGITYIGSTLNKNYNKYLDMYLIVDGSGAVYLEAFMEMGGKFYYFQGSDDGLMGLTGYTADDFYSSIIYAEDKDGDPYLFWSRFDGSSQDLIAIDVDSSDTVNAYRLGGFDSAVWPVAGLMTDVPALSSSVNTDALSTASVSPVSAASAIEIQPIGTAVSRANTGSLNSVEVGSTAGSAYQVKIDASNHTVTVPVVASDSTNGLFTLSYDPSILTFESATYGNVLHSAATASGKVTVAYASAEAYNGLVASIVFSYPSTSYHNRETSISLVVGEDGASSTPETDSTTLILPGNTLPGQPSTPSNPSNPGKPSEPSEPTTPGKSFDDVKTGDWFYTEVTDMANKGYINGVSDKLFAPNQALSRAMLVTILYRMDGAKATSTASTFSDVVKDSWYEKAVDWAAANGIVNGYSSTLFGPDDLVTRQQMAAILWRYAQYKGLDVSANGTVMPSFPDRDQIASWAGEAISWAYSRGVMTGRSGGMLDPNGNATRAEAAVMLYRFQQLSANNGGEKM